MDVCGRHDDIRERSGLMHEGAEGGRGSRGVTVPDILACFRRGNDRTVPSSFVLRPLSLRGGGGLCRGRGEGAFRA